MYAADRAAPRSVVACRTFVRGERRGFTVLLVLALISMTLGVSYALLRTQAASARSSANGRMRGSARQAALTGLSAGLRRISQTSWGGVGTSLTGNVSGSDTYSVSYTAGDASLAVTATNAADWPYRVTIAATGYSVDPTASTVSTTYKVEAVVRLIPKKLAANPSAWSTMLPYTFYQTKTDSLSIQLPLQINGPQHWQGGLTTFMSSYPTTLAQRNQFLTDLNAMRSNGYPDCRPFTGVITMPTGSTTTTVRSQLTSNLGLNLTNSPGSNVSNWSHPGTVSTYRLFPGGPSYNVPSLGTTISGTTLQADPRTNPAGIFFRNGDLSIGNNTTVVGTLIATGDINLVGTNVSLQAPTLIALDGATALPQLPTAVVGDDFQLQSGSGATVVGTVAAFDDFINLAGTQSTAFNMQGTLIAAAVITEVRNEWNFGSLWWSLLWSAYNGQSSVPYWPVYAAGSSLDYTPRLSLNPAPATNVVRQWFTGDAPVYDVGTGDPGLKWSVLRVTELR